MDIELALQGTIDQYNGPKINISPKKVVQIYREILISKKFITKRTHEQCQVKDYQQILKRRLYQARVHDVSFSLKIVRIISPTKGSIMKKNPIKKYSFPSWKNIIAKMLISEFSLKILKLR